jgi:hypothetical protein
LWFLPVLILTIHYGSEALIQAAMKRVFSFLWSTYIPTTKQGSETTVPMFSFCSMVSLSGLPTDPDLNWSSTPQKSKCNMCSAKQTTKGKLISNEKPTAREMETKFICFQSNN